MQATYFTKKMLIEQERLDYLERAQRREQMTCNERSSGFQRLSKFRVLSFRRAFYPEQKRRKTSVTAVIEIYRDQDRKTYSKRQRNFEKV